MYEITTYDMDAALRYFADEIRVYVIHPNKNDKDVQMMSQDDILDSEGHLFLIRK